MGQGPHPEPDLQRILESIAKIGICHPDFEKKGPTEVDPEKSLGEDA